MYDIMYKLHFYSIYKLIIAQYISYSCSFFFSFLFSFKQMFLIQCEWNITHIVVIVLSFGSWIGVAYIVSASTLIDPDFYFVRTNP